MTRILAKKEGVLQKTEGIGGEVIIASHPEAG